MFRTTMIVITTALMAASLLVAADASAAGHGGHGGRKPILKAGNHKAGTPSFASHMRNGHTSSNNGNYGMSGPYTGLKFIGNQ